ncbi:glutathione S-transferase [Kangiella sp. HZ709]|uniref:glutathione S-transferase n=1 Tax=Kangiella sp. HZ709 TaxID=2666328 RepID=UPI0012AF2C3F|nr:glutathione S-transferase [Kangiella sp. HZ709]MRX28128.1 glutathione S-transferase [Kangiella sp. HZ709]
MKLIYSNASPYARTARIAIRELALLAQIEEINQHPFDNPAQLISFNPLCKVPCLIDSNGQGLFDSQVICEYLDALVDNKLFADINNDWQLKTLYSLTRGILDSSVAWQQDKVRGEEGCSEFWQKRFISSIDRGLNYLQKRIDQLPEKFNAIDINLITTLDYLAFRHPDYDWQQMHPKLASWYQTKNNRSSLTETMPQE